MMFRRIRYSNTNSLNIAYADKVASNIFLFLKRQKYRSSSEKVYEEGVVSETTKIVCSFLA